MMANLQKTVRVGSAAVVMDLVDVGGAFPQAQITIGAKDVTVDVEDAGGAQVKLIAQCGSTRLERVHVVGGTDPATIADNIDAADEQVKFDEARAQLALYAERLERAATAKQSLQ